MKKTNPSTLSKSELDAKIDATIREAELLIQKIDTNKHHEPTNSIHSNNNGNLHTLTKFRILFLIIFIFTFIGSCLELTIGRGFILYSLEKYYTIIAWIILPLLLIISLSIQWINNNIRPLTSHSKIKSKLLIRYFVFPVIVALAAAAIISAPLGWAALVGWTFGVRSYEIPGIIIDASSYRSRSRACNQDGEIKVGELLARICLDNRVVDPKIKPGDAIFITGKISPLGIFVEEVRSNK